MIPWLEQDTPFPPVHTALLEPNGLLAAGGDLSAERLLEAYKQGIFPWFSQEQPILWWSPDPRMVLLPNELKISRSLKKTLKNHPFKIYIDTAFDAVMESCASPRSDRAGTWITPSMCVAYGKLFELGYAHSVETWLNDKLVGGLYGVAIGKVFYGESMFSTISDTSKIALVHLVHYIRQLGFELIDCQMSTLHLASLGGREIPREEFIARIKTLVNYPMKIGHWCINE